MGLRNILRKLVLTVNIVQRIKFGEDDSPPSAFYAFLARSIIEMLAKGGKCVEVTGRI